MSSYPPPGPGPAPGSFGSRIEEAVELIEMELRHAIAYVNDAVIPQVRKESITAMRSLSETLRNLADTGPPCPPRWPGSCSSFQVATTATIPPAVRRRLRPKSRRPTPLRHL